MATKNTLKKLLPTLLVLIVFLVLALVNTFVLKPERGREVIEKELEVTFLDLPREKIDKVEVMQDKGKVQLQKKKGRWWVKKQRWLKASQSLIDTLLNTADRWQAVRSLGKIRNLKRYQLDQTTHKITFFQGSTALAQVIIGSKNPTGSAYFVRQDQEIEIFVVDDYKVDAFLKKADDFRETQLLSFSETEVRELEINHQGKRYLYKKGKKRWEMLKPYHKKTTKLHDEVDLMLTTLANLVSMEFGEDTPKDLTKYQLSSPVTTIRIKLSSKKHLGLKIGKDKEHNVYAQTEDDPAIYIVGGFLKERVSSLLDQSQPSKGKHQKKSRQTS